MDEASDEDLLSKSFNYICDDGLLVEPVLFERLLICNFNPVDELWHHDSFAGEFVDYFGYM